MQQKADLSQIVELASRMKRIDSNLENQIMGMHKQTSRMIQEINSQYNESYVRSATQEVEETLNRIYSMAESISKKLRRKSESLIWSANHYKQTEDQLKLKLIQPFKFSWRAPTIGNSSSSNFVLPKADKVSVFKVSGSVTLMQMLKNLWSKARDSLLIKSLAFFQEDERISSLIKQIQSGTLDEQKVARQHLSEIAHAFDEIARSQVAYAIYSDFGNLTYMKAAQAQANLNREALAGLGVSDKWYNVDVNLAENYKDSPLSACRYNPLKEDGSGMPDLPEMTLILTAARAYEPYREWVKANYEHVESTVNQAAQQRQAMQEIVDEYNRSMSPDEIKVIQTQLQSMNYYQGEITGKYTVDLLAALAEYYQHGDPEESPKETEESKNGFYKSLDSFKEIGQGILGSLQNRANKATDSPYDFFNWLTLGLTGDLPSGIYAGAKDRADHSFDSVQKFADWLTLGTVEMAKGAFNPEEAWSAEHWMNSLGMATLITGPLESQLLKPSTGMGIPKLPDPPSLRDISSPRGRESPNKNPVVVTPEGLRIKFDEVHAETKPLTKTPVQEHFNKEMEQLRKGVVEGIEGTGEAKTYLRNIDDFVSGNKKFDEVLDDYAIAYAEKVNSNVPWKWRSIPGGDALSQKQIKLIRERAKELGEIPDVPMKPETKFPDFEKADLIIKIDGEPVIIQLPKEYWKNSDPDQFNWLDSQLPGGKRPPGTTWHHSEIDGRMELLPFGIHNSVYHSGGRAPGGWADGKR